VLARLLELKPPDQLDAADGSALSPGLGATASPAQPPGLEDLTEDSARLLADGALALFAIYAVVVAFDILPPRLTDPLWLLTASTALVNAVSIPLAGVVFLHLAAAIAPYTNWIHQRRQRISRFAALASLGFLLIVPLLGFATWRGITNVNTATQKQSRAYTTNARRLLQVIDNSATSRELQQGMAALQGPQIRDQDLSQPLPVLKKAQSQIVKQVLAAYLNQLPKPDSAAFKTVYYQTLRTGALALVSSLAFAAVVWDPLRRQSLLQKLLGRSSGGISGLQREQGGLLRTINKYLEHLKRSTSKDAVEAQRLSEWRRRQKESDRAKKQVERSQSLRDREMKRNLAQQRKLSQQRERQRQLAEREARRNANRNNRNP